MTNGDALQSGQLLLLPRRARHAMAEMVRKTLLLSTTPVTVGVFALQAVVVYWFQQLHLRQSSAAVSVVQWPFVR